MIQLVGLYPQHLNLNGDFGNLEVIAKQLQWRGIDRELVMVTRPEELPSKPHFVLIGHGSIAAWADIAASLIALTPALKALVQAGVPVMGISTGYEHMVREGFFDSLTPAQNIERISKFEIIDDGDNEVLGYLNTNKDLPTLARAGSAFGTMLHGPVLAKNSQLLEEILGGICRSAGVECADIQSNEKASQLADLIDRVWELERQLSNE